MNSQIGDDGASDHRTALQQFSGRTPFLINCTGMAHSSAASDESNDGRLGARVVGTVNAKIAEAHFSRRQLLPTFRELPMDRSLLRMSNQCAECGGCAAAGGCSACFARGTRLNHDVPIKVCARKLVSLTSRAAVLKRRPEKIFAFD